MGTFLENAYWVHWLLIWGGTAIFLLCVFSAWHFGYTRGYERGHAEGTIECIIKAVRDVGK